MSLQVYTSVIGHQEDFLMFFITIGIYKTILEKDRAIEHRILPIFPSLFPRKSNPSCPGNKQEIPFTGSSCLSTPLKPTRLH